MACAVACEPQNYPCGTCNCDPDGRDPWGDKWKIPGVIESDVCLRKLLTPFSILMLDLYQHYGNGVLPFSGGLLEQPYTYFRAMTIVQYWIKQNARPESKGNT